MEKKKKIEVIRTFGAQTYWLTLGKCVETAYFFPWATNKSLCPPERCIYSGQ